MASIIRKPTKDKLGKHSGAGAARPNGGTQAPGRSADVRRASELLKHISDPVRLEIVRALTEGEQQVGVLCKRLSNNQPSVSHHLALLRHAKIIESRRQGNHNFYSLTSTGADLAYVVDCLTEDFGETRSSVRPQATTAGSPRVGKSRSTVSKPNPEPRSEGTDGGTEASLALLNRRRAELIFKKNRDHLTVREQSELEQLQRDSLARTQRDFPGPTHIDEKLRKLEERLRGRGAEKA